ncbi:MAG: transcription elongation factor GreA [Bacteroidales bacterium]|nr:transcription elongation factor GreA [Bacteroidales bacterium]
MNIKYCTTESLEKLKTELSYLINTERPAISQQIADARDKGDLSENAEYDAAKNAQGMLELRISQLEETIRNSRIIDETKIDVSKVAMLSTVELKNLKNNSHITYTLVPENEADIKKGKISISSPVARGLLGKSTGDKVDIKVPAGSIAFEIIKISR